MSYPKNPDTIIVKNKYYPYGLTELDVWNYYQKVKYKLIQFLDNRTVFFDIATDLNHTVIRRKGKDSRLFFINTSNFEEVITGRTLAVHGVMNREENFGIIDIDIDNLDMAKDTANDVYNFIKNGKIDFIKSVSIRFTGKTSFHIICNLRRKMDIDIIRVLLRSELINSNLIRNYTVESKRRRGIPNLDLSSNKINGGFISLNSLSIVGLPCIELSIKDLNKFRPEKFTIKNTQG